MLCLSRLSSSSLRHCHLHRPRPHLLSANGTRKTDRLSLGFGTSLLCGHCVTSTLSISSALPVGNAGGDANDLREFRVLSAVQSTYNKIVVIETRSSRFLLLDDTQNIHSILLKNELWTNAYWDEFASLPPIIPQGPVALFGLGGGTAAHILLNLWPSLLIDGWELDEILIDRARAYFGLSDLEKPTEAGGFLRVCIGDALSGSANVPGGYAGIIVDLFFDGKVLPQLEEVKTWLDLRGRLKPEGRIMVNCGGTDNKVSHEHPALKALSGAFDGQLNWKKTQQDNYLALTGPLPDLNWWSNTLPPPLSSAVKLWKPL